MKERTRAKWAERIGEWRDSGKSAEEFTVGKDYGASGLRWAASQLMAEKETRPTPPSGPASRRQPPSEGADPPGAQPPRFMPVRMRKAQPDGAEMIVEVGGARIRVTRGMDVVLLGDVVRALQGGSR